MNKKFILSISGAIAVLVIAVLVSQTMLPGGSTRVAAREGFGKLPTLTAQSGGFGSGGDMARTQSGGMGSTAPMIAEQGVSDAKLTILPDGEWFPPKYEFLFEGELPEVPEEMLVFRDRPIQSGRDVLNLLARLTGIGSLRGISTANVEHISVSIPNSPFHYSLDQSGRFYLWSNEQTYFREMSSANAPGDEELITLAKNFAQSQGIDLSGYGEPYVDQSWVMWAAYDKAIGPDFYPSQIQVIFPQEFEGLPLVNWGGTDDPGFSVNIDLGTKKVTSAGGRVQNMRDKSLYTTRTQDEVRNEIANGGMNSPHYYGYETLTASQEARRPVHKVVFDKIRLGYIQHFKYTPGGSENYYIPVYAVSGTLTDEMGNQHPYGTIIPAIKGDFFEPPMHIMPAAEPRG